MVGVVVVVDVCGMLPIPGAVSGGCGCSGYFVATGSRAIKLPIPGAVSERWLWLVVGAVVVVVGVVGVLPISRGDDWWLLVWWLWC